MLFLNNLSPNKIDQFFPSVDFSFATGARVSVHARGTPANIYSGVTVSPGVETTLVVNQVRRKRLMEPWNTCTDQQYLYQDIEEDGYRYTSDSCFSLCVQDQVGNDLNIEIAKLRLLIVYYSICVRNI